MLKEEFFIFFLLWINEKKIKKNKFGEDESKFISIIDNVYPVFRFMFFFLLLLSFFFVVDEFFQQYYICWVTTRLPSHIYKHLLRFLCNKMPCRPIYFFFLHFILFNSKALEFFFFFCHCSVPPWFLHRSVALFQMQVRSVSFFRRNHVHTE